jgi:protoporphyrinogen oxidase
MKVGVIGAGPAGLTAAYQLIKGGAEVVVFEAGGAVGGMSRTIPLWGQKVDLGPHRFFSQDRRVNRLWRELVADDFCGIDRLTRIYYKNKFYYYPLQPLNALRNMGIFEATHCLCSYSKEKMAPSFSPDAQRSFESWVVGRFGRRLFEMFFKSYTEKLWGISCQDLDADFAMQRIKKFSMGEAVKSALGLSERKHATLVDRFDYPRGGSGLVYERMVDYIRQRGGKIHLNQSVRRVLCDNRRVRGLQLSGGDAREFQHVVSTMPLTLLVRGLGDLPDKVARAADALTYRNTILVYLRVGGRDLFPDQWVYVHSPELLTGRLTNFRNWSEELHGGDSSSILALEYWCYDSDPLWTARERDLIEIAIREIRSTGLIGDAPIAGGRVERVARSYPVYVNGYKQHVARIAEKLDSIDGLTAIGRYGSFKYNNQDHSILMGILAAENILHHRGHDLWSINTDYENYQEAGRREDAYRRRAA